jgi:hypothetical protein
MAETVGATRDEQAGLWVSVVLIVGSFLLFLLQMPAVSAGHGHFSPWIYVPGVLSFFVAAWKKADAVAWLAIAWMSLFFMIDVYYGTGLFW